MIARRLLAFTARPTLPLRRDQSVQRATTVRADRLISRRAPLANIRCPRPPLAVIARRLLAVTARLTRPLRRDQSVQRATTVRADLLISRRAPLANIRCPSAPRRPPLAVIVGLASFRPQQVRL